jgi:hypothetical protein
MVEGLTKVDRVPEWSPNACVGLAWLHVVRHPAERPHHEEREKDHLHMVIQEACTNQGEGLHTSIQVVKAVSPSATFVEVQNCDP